MDLLVRIADRAILGHGYMPTPPADPALRVVAVPDAAFAALVPGGNPILGPDNQSIVMQPYSAQQQADAAAVQSIAALRVQHGAALAQLRPVLVANAGGISGDLAALRDIAATLQAGAQPTGAQLLQVLRVVLRVLAISQ